MDLMLFKFIIFLLPLFIVLKRKGKIPHEPSLLEKLEKDAYTNEKQFCPILPSLGSRWHPQKTSKLCGVKCSLDIFKQRIEMRDLSETVDISSDMLNQLPGLIEREEKNKKVYHTVCEDGESCYFLKITFEDFYAVSPKIPRWVHAFKDELRNKGDMLKSSDRFSETRIQDLLRLRLGSKEVSRLKTNPSQLRKVTELGELIAFYTLASRSTKTYMQKPGADGNNLLHLACLYGHSHIVISLMRMGCDVNQPNEFNSIERTSPLSIAAGSGHIDIVASLITHGADATHVDYKGWIPLHYAAYNNYQYIVRYLVQRNPDSLNTVTQDSNECTPLLLAIQAGALDTVTQLLRLGASIDPIVGEKYTLVQWTAMNCHINILKYFIELKRGDIPVWQALTDMLKSADIQEIECSARMLDPLSKISNEYFQELYNAGGIDALISLLDKGEELQFLCTLVLQNISYQPLVKKALGSTQVVSQLTNLLASQNISEKLQWRIVVILSDMVTISTDSTDRTIVTEYQDIIHSQGAISHIVPILTSSSYDLRLNACYCLCQLAKLNTKCKKNIVKAKALPKLVSLLQDPSHDIKIASAMAIASIVEDNTENQMSVVETGAVDFLVNLLFSDVSLVQNSAAQAIENIASKNQNCQDIILANSKSKSGLARLSKMKENQTKTCGLFALYAIAGSKLDTKKVIANFITIPMLADMIELGDLKLELVCADALNALATGQSNIACRIYKEAGVLPVFRTLQGAIREMTHNQGDLENVRERILHLTDTLYSFLLAQALTPNIEIQEAFYENNNIYSLMNLLSVGDNLLRAKSWLCIAAYMRDNQRAYRNLEKGMLFNIEQNNQHLNINDLLSLLKSEYCLARVIAILSLALFVFNNKPFQRTFSRNYTLRLSYKDFTDLKEDYFNSTNFCDITFSQITLASFFRDISSADVIINGLQDLINLLSDSNELIVIESLNYLAALSRTTEGIPAAIIGANGIEHCFKNLFHQANSVARMAAVVLGYLTFNPTARRNILTAFRLDPYLCYMFNKHFSVGEICKKFKYEWEMTATKGLPALSLDEEILMRKYNEGFLPPSKKNLTNRFIASNLISKNNCKDKEQTDITNDITTRNSKSLAIVRDGPLMQRKLALLDNPKPQIKNTLTTSKKFYDSFLFEDSTIH
ncbi:Ankyrin and armadillo repeat-containing protein-like [Oopsacas minuta]|uniref:Ankyrin and armadillo repeat-containing protein-like n=1 Tax=Oopsacas minuta TaxID=111878 RepID=A0AAV7JT79_9METZ|nr:Ankyrin and armadillo repeat-containing protein-like [Oopsacas minuta]